MAEYRIATRAGKFRVEVKVTHYARFIGKAYDVWEPAWHVEADSLEKAQEQMDEMKRREMPWVPVKIRGDRGYFSRED